MHSVFKKLHYSSIQVRSREIVFAFHGYAELKWVLNWSSHLIISNKTVTNCQVEVAMDVAANYFNRFTVRSSLAKYDLCKYLKS